MKAKGNEKIFLTHILKRQERDLNRNLLKIKDAQEHVAYLTREIKKTKQELKTLN